MSKSKPHLLRQSLWLTSCLASVLASLSALSAWCSPTFCRWLSLFSLGYPVLMLAAVLLCLIAFFVWRRRAWLPLLLLLPACHALCIYFPYTYSQTTENTDTLRVMTYNVFYWSFQSKDEIGLSPMARYIARQHPDILFVQEAYCDQDYYKKSMLPVFRQVGLTHFHSMAIENDNIGVVSRFPIIDQGRIKMPGQNNGAAWFRLLRAKGDTLLAISAHLQSVGLSENDRRGYSHITVGEENGTLSQTKRTSLRIAQKLATSSVTRATQAKMLQKFLIAHRGEKIILGGDFNDTPISYPHHTVSRELTDAYRKAGRGLGRSFNQHRMIVRIDHVFTSSHFEPYRAVVDNSVTLSDHYPLIVDIAVKKEEP